MNTLVVLLGVRGAGKSTLLERFHKLKAIKVLKPSTTRPRRDGDGDQYHYHKIEEWNADRKKFAWTINVKEHLYGMQLSELLAISSDKVGMTVFHPGNIEELNKFRRDSAFETVTIGLDTIDTYADQSGRINGETSRDEGLTAFNEQKEVVRKCDVVLKGDEETVFNAVSAVIRILNKRGVLDKQSISELLAAGTLLQDASSENVRSASYDLRLGVDSWCRGKLRSLDRSNPLVIPPYSYAIVESQEKAELPNFIVARYDLTVSLFLDGIILSNGPQVDPGFKGGLLCMLFNGSDQPVGIQLGGHFATLEFSATTRVTGGYGEHHQGQKSLAQFMSRNMVVGPGGTIIERIGRLEEVWDRFQNQFLRGTLIAVVAVVVAIITIIVPLVTWSYDAARNADDATAKADHAVSVAGEKLDDDKWRKGIEDKLDRLSAQEQDTTAAKSTGDKGSKQKAK